MTSKTKKKAGKRKRTRRTLEQKLADCEAELERLKALKNARDQFSIAALKADRERLQLSAADYGELVGVAGITIYFWEGGRSRPREEQLMKWLAVQGMTREEAWKQLGIVEVDEAGHFSPEAVRAERQRLGLSAKKYAQLVGVSMMTIYKWEWGNAEPARAALEKWLAVRGISKAEAQRRVGA